MPNLVLIENRSIENCYQIIAKIELLSNDQTNNKIVKKITLQPIYFDLNQLPFWNLFRQKIFEIIEKRFIQQVIEKGIKKQEHKIIIQNNYDEFVRFFQRKFRYFLLTLVKRDELNQLIGEFNQIVIKEIAFNLDNYKKKKSELTQINNLIKIINKQLKHTILNDFSYNVAKFILTEKNYLEELVKNFDEFIYYLIVF
ncbi:MAG: hypothetical protein JXA54_09365 [Candidatus Heimdallarchaeota archaeon]|nr:hypothetical protein [Candidatus Heimdallarchaeota archaeon]